MGREEDERGDLVRVEGEGFVDDWGSVGGDMVGGVVIKEGGEGGVKSVEG